MRKSSVAVPFLVIAVGVGWLLTALNVLPDVKWAWVLGLGAVGLLVLAVGGFDKLTVVVGPFFVACSVLSLLRQTGRIDINSEIPLLVIIGGVLMLIPYIAPLPSPDWYLDATRPSDKQPPPK